MTLTLILTRHAKSSWDDPMLDDHERPLNGRGRASARAIGKWLAEHDITPSVVLLSSATRARETWAHMVLSMPNPVEVKCEPALYLAHPDIMMRQLRTATANAVQIVGHNPGICEFARRLVQRAPDHPRFHDYPTGTTTVMTFDAPTWRDVEWKQGTVQAFAIPRDLLS